MIAQPWPDSATATGDLVVELSQIEHAVQGHPGHDLCASTTDAHTERGLLLKRRREVVLELRRRGVSIADENHAAEPPTSERPGGTLVARLPEPASNTLVDDLTTTVAHLEHALASRGQIGQAQGVLMERHKITADQAFRLLVKVSNDTNRKLAVVAEELARTGSLPPLREAHRQRHRPAIRLTAHRSIADGQ